MKKPNDKETSFKPIIEAYEAKMDAMSPLATKRYEENLGNLSRACRTHEEETTSTGISSTTGTTDVYGGSITLGAGKGPNASLSPKYEQQNSTQEGNTKSTSNSTEKTQCGERQLEQLSEREKYLIAVDADATLRSQFNSALQLLQNAPRGKVVDKHDPDFRFQWNEKDGVMVRYYFLNKEQPAVLDTPEKVNKYIERFTDHKRVPVEELIQELKQQLQNKQSSPQSNNASPNANKVNVALGSLPTLKEIPDEIRDIALPKHLWNQQQFKVQDGSKPAAVVRIGSEAVSLYTSNQVEDTRVGSNRNAHNVVRQVQKQIVAPEIEIG